MLDALVLAAFRHSEWVRSCQLAAVAALAYEYLLTFGDEVELFWRKRWSFGKAIFLWSRYYSLLFNIGNATVFLNKSVSLHLCEEFFHWQDAGATLQIITTHVILELRLYAMYESKKWILALFVCLTMVEAAAMGAFVGFPVAGLRVTNQPLDGPHICADGDPIHRHWIAYYWTCLLVIESTLLSLSCYRAFVLYRRGTGGSIMRLLTRDSILYFIIIFGIYMGNQITWLRNDITLTELATGFSFSISAILANRLLLNVRSSYFNQTNQSHETKDTHHAYNVYSSTAPAFQTFSTGSFTDVEREGSSRRVSVLPARLDRRAIGFELSLIKEDKSFYTKPS